MQKQSHFYYLYFALKVTLPNIEYIFKFTPEPRKWPCTLSTSEVSDGGGGGCKRETAGQHHQCISVYTATCAVLVAGGQQYLISIDVYFTIYISAEYVYL